MTSVDGFWVEFDMYRVAVQCNLGFFKKISVALNQEDSSHLANANVSFSLTINFNRHKWWILCATPGSHLVRIDNIEERCVNCTPVQQPHQKLELDDDTSKLCLLNVSKITRNVPHYASCETKQILITDDIIQNHNVGCRFNHRRMGRDGDLDNLLLADRCTFGRCIASFYRACRLWFCGIKLNRFFQ